MPISNWYVVFTRPNWEKKVVGSLSRKGMECYCPYKVAVGVSGNRKKAEKEPLFSSYVFVRINSLQLVDIKKVEGVINLMYWMDKPAVVKDIEVEMMRRFLNEHDNDNVHVEKTLVNINDIVKIRIDASTVDGSSIGIKSTINTLTLPSIGYSLVAEVPAQNIELIIKEDPIHIASQQ